MIGGVGSWSWPTWSGKDVVILGAGFSKAVSCRFPLTAELGDEAFERAGISQTERPAAGTGFEAWLSRIAEDQPYRSVEDNLAAKRCFVQMSSAIGAVLRERQRQALAEASPPWLDDLLSVLHAREAAVVSFNYDNVMECAVDGHCLADRAPDWHSPARVTSHDILDRLPPLPPAIASEELPPRQVTYGGSIIDHRDPARVARSLRLLKLHGSLSWYWSPDDDVGVTLQRWRPPGTFDHPAEGDDEDEARRRALPGRVPFIVPPTATKSSYLTNLVMREIWARAQVALAKATRVIVVGYSVPAEDQVAGGMLAEALGRRDVEVVVVDSDAEQVVDRLERLGIAASEGRRFSGCSCVEDFVSWYRDEQARAVGESLRCALAEGGGIHDKDHDGIQGRVSVTWGPCEHPICREQSFMCSHDGEINTQAICVAEDELRLPLLPPGSSRSPDHTRLPTLLGHLSGADPVRRLVVRTSSGQDHPVVDYPVVDYTMGEPQHYVGEDRDPNRHLTLVPSGHPKRRG